MKLLDIDDVITIAKNSENARFSMLDGKEYYVVDTRNMILGIKGMDSLFTYDHLFSWYRRKKVFFQIF